MIRRILRPSPTGTLVVGIISIAALIISLLSLRAAIDSAGRKATHAALCTVWAYQIGSPEDPPPSTDRGRTQLAKALMEYRKLGCKPDR